MPKHFRAFHLIRYIRIHSSKKFQNFCHSIFIKTFRSLRNLSIDKRMSDNSHYSSVHGSCRGI